MEIHFFWNAIGINSDKKNAFSFILTFYLGAFFRLQFNMIMCFTYNEWRMLLAGKMSSFPWIKYSTKCYIDVAVYFHSVSISLHFPHWLAFVRFSLHSSIYFPLVGLIFHLFLINSFWTLLRITINHFSIRLYWH